MSIKVENLPSTRLSMQHLSASTRKAFAGPIQGWPAAGFDGFHGILIYAHDENLGVPPIPDDMWAILEQARRAGIEYVHFDEDLEPVAGLPVYGLGSDKPNDLNVFNIDIGKLFFAGTRDDVTLVCMMEAFDDEALYAHVYNLDMKAKFSRLSGRLLGLSNYGGDEPDYQLPSPSLHPHLEWGYARVEIRLIGDPDFDFGAAEQSEAALDWARRQLAKPASAEVDDTPSP